MSDGEIITVYLLNITDVFNLENLKILITAVIAVFGWVVGHYFNSKRDRKLKRREIITTHLINAYRILANDITPREVTSERDFKLETVISELQLFVQKNR